MELQGNVSAIMAPNQRDIGLAVGNAGRLFWRTDKRIDLESWALTVYAAQAAAWRAGTLQTIDTWTAAAVRAVRDQGYGGRPIKGSRASTPVNMDRVLQLDATFTPPVATP